MDMVDVEGDVGPVGSGDGKDGGSGSETMVTEGGVDGSVMPEATDPAKVPLSSD